MEFDEENLTLKKIEIELNKKIILSILLVSFLSIVFAGCLAYIFSGSLFTVFCSLVIGITVGFLIDYLIISSQKFVKNVNIEFSCEEKSSDDLHTVMKIE